MLLSMIAYGQNYTGIVTDSKTAEPLIGLSIYNLNNEIGTTTDFDGSYEIQAKPNDTLEFSYIGYQTQKIIVGNNFVIDVQLLTDAEILDEVIVVGYGAVKKSDLTGSITQIKSEELLKVPSSNAVQGLQGKVSGLQILSTSGDPGANPVVRLRGVTTLNDNNPIAVIDGVITDVGAISLLNSNDIASIEVLKDASATAIYGTRGAAGVIIVTTKKGTSGKDNIQFSFERSIENVGNKIDVMTGREFATYLNEIDPGTFNNLDALADTDWHDLIYKENTAITNANLSYSTGNEKNNHYIGLGYFNQEGVLPKSGLERFTAKINSNYKIAEFMNFGLDFSTMYSEKENAPGVVNNVLRALPITAPFNEDGSFADVNGGNPLAAIEFSNSTNKRVRALGNLYASVNFLKNFTFKTSLQFDANVAENRSFTPSYFVGPLQQNADNDLALSRNLNLSTIFENTLNYQQSFGPHNISLLVGHTSQTIRGENLEGRTEGLLREDDNFWFLDAGQDDLDQVSNNLRINRLESYLGRINYSFDSKYLVTASIRRDGSSNFGANNRFGVFPSMALGWNIYNESFFPKNSFLNSAKLRLSWGITGNEKIDVLAQYATIANGQDAVLGQNESLNAGASFDSGGNPNLKWEQTTQSNIGVNLGFFENRILAEVDYYVKNTEDILVALEPVGYLGIGANRSIFFNAADVENKGLEWQVSYQDKKGKFNYSIGVLGTTISNKVTNIGQGIGADSLIIGGDLGNGQQVGRSAVGEPIGFLYGYETIGVYQNQADLDNSASFFNSVVGDLKYKDLNGDGKIDGFDRTRIGSSIPELIYGFNVEVGYEGFSLAADFQGQRGSDIYNGKQAIRFTTVNFEEKYNNYWTGEGSTNTHPRASSGGNNFLPSSYYVESGDFFRLRSLTLNYKLNGNLLNKVKASNVNIYLRATNLFTVTNFTGYSPEIGATNAIDGVIDRGTYPISKIYTLGLNVQF